MIVRFNPKLIGSDGQQVRDVPFSPGQSIKYYLSETDFPLEGTRIILSGRVVEDLEEKVKEHDEIIIAPDIGVPAAAWAVIKVIWVIIVVCMTIYSIYSAITARKPSRNTNGSGLDDGSSVYGWDGIRTTQEIGIPIPVVYGTHMVGGNTINNYISTDGDSHYLNTLLALCEGPIKAVGQIYINQNRKENYSDITYDYRLGTNSQSPIANFNMLHNIYNVNVTLLQGAAFTYTMINAAQGFDLYFTFPQGLYKQDDQGNVAAWDVTFLVEYKLHSAGSWTSAGSTTISYKTRTNLHRTWSIRNLASGIYDVRVTKTSADPTISPVTVGDFAWGAIDEIIPQDLAYPNTALIGIQALATDQLNGTSPNFTTIVQGKLVQIPNVLNGGVSVPWEQYYYDPATSQYKLISNGTVLTWDGTTFIEGWSANPIWCLMDLLTNTRYGLGQFIDTSMIDLSSFITMSQYCENLVPDGVGGQEKRFLLNIVLDASTSALDMLEQIGITFRGLIYYSCGTIKVKIDKPDTPVQLFGMGNIVEGSFQQQWLSIKSRFNVVEAQYLDQNNMYVQNKVAVTDDAALSAGDPIRKQQIKVFATTPSQCYREARFNLWKNKYLKRSVAFRAGIDAICCEAGDVINVSHDVPQWGFSGRIVAGTTNTVTIDQSVTILPGITYKIMVAHADDTAEELTVTNVPGTYTTLTTSTNFAHTPAAFDKYAFGPATVETKPFRIQSIKFNNDHTADIQALEYNASIYDDTAPAVSLNYSSLSAVIPDVSDLKLTERLVLLSDGTIGDCIDVWWRTPDSTSVNVMWAKGQVYLSDNGGLSWVFMGETSGDSFSIINNLMDGTTYTVAVVSIGADGAVKDLATAPRDNITLVGKSAPPSNVTQFVVNQARDRVFFSWAPISDLDVSGYEIRYGSSWNAGAVIATQIKNSNYISLNLKTGAGQSYWIKAIDTSGNYSLTETQAVVTIDNIPFQNIVQSYAEETGFTGTKVNTSVVGSNLEISTGQLSGTYVTPVRDIGYVATFGIRIDAVIVDASSSDRMNDNMTETMDDNLTERMSGLAASGNATYEIKTSIDNIAWSAWAPWQSGDFKCRYFQLRMTIGRASTSQVIRCSNFDYYADLPDVVDRGNGSVAVAATGCAVTFAKTFHQAPNIAINVLSGSGVFYNFSVIPSTTGFTVKLYDLAGTAQTGTFSWVAQGI